MTWLYMLYTVHDIDELIQLIIRLDAEIIVNSNLTDNLFSNTNNRDISFLSMTYKVIVWKTEAVRQNHDWTFSVQTWKILSCRL